MKKRKPVNYFAVIICLLLALAVIATLILPVFQVKVNLIGVEGEYISTTGLDIIKAWFLDGSDFLNQSEAVQNLYTLLGKSGVDLMQSTHSINLVIAINAYFISLCLACILVLFSVINLFGHRLSVLNVLTGLLLIISGVVTIIYLFLQNNSVIENVVFTYHIKHYIGEIAIPIIGFLYMMFAPKKRV